MSANQSRSNLALWESVCETDPRYTKEFNRGGGFKGTATNAVYLVKRATEVWGPMGGNWGIRIVKEETIEGAPIMIDGHVICREVIHKITAEIFHPGGVVPAIGQTTFVGRNKNGIYTDEEAPKKSLTDALSKGLSWLGFSADIHLGLYDDNKYVNDLRHKISEEEARKREEAERAELEERARKQTDHLTAIDSAENAEALEKAVKEAKEWATKYKDRQAWVSFSQHEKARKKQLGIEVAA